MSYITDIARTVLGKNIYQYILNNMYGMNTNVNIMQEINRNMLIYALDLNDTLNYYSQSQLDCLNGKVHRQIKTPTSSINPMNIPAISANQGKI